MCPVKQGTDSGDLGENFSAAVATNESLIMMHTQLKTEIQDVKMDITKEFEEVLKKFTSTLPGSCECLSTSCFIILVDLNL